MHCPRPFSRAMVSAINLFTSYRSIINLFFSRLQTQTMTAYCKKQLHQTTMFEIFFSGSSDTNNGSLLQNTTYTGPPRLRYLFQVVQTQTMYDSLLSLIVQNTTCTRPPRLRNLSRTSDTNHGRLLKNTAYIRPPRLKYNNVILPQCKFHCKN